MLVGWNRTRQFQVESEKVTSRSPLGCTNDFTTGWTGSYKEDSIATRKAYLHTEHIPFAPEFTIIMSRLSATCTMEMGIIGNLVFSRSKAITLYSPLWTGMVKFSIEFRGMVTSFTQGFHQWYELHRRELRERQYLQHTQCSHKYHHHQDIQTLGGLERQTYLSE